MNRRIIHAADIHLDSPLQKLSSYEGAPADQIRRASREALNNLVDFALASHVNLVVIAGDLYDGDWNDQNTGLFFVAQATRLVEAGIPILVIRGNHDAANLMTSSLPLPRNPDGSEIMLSSEAVECRLFDSLGIAVHGKSFQNRSEHENLAASYGPALGGFFNLGLLHTSLGGFEGHDPYAPCTPSELADKQYDYWALGHIHQRGNHEIEGAAPVVYSGNLQGRHARECGPKGCYLIDVNDRNQCELSFHELDVVRWEKCIIQGSSLNHLDDVFDQFQEWLTSALAACGEKLLVVRVEVTGTTIHSEALRYQSSSMVGGLRSIAVSHGRGRVWIEQLKIRTKSKPVGNSESEIEGPLASLNAILEMLRGEGDCGELIKDDVKNLQKKLPHDILDWRAEFALDDKAVLDDLLESASSEVKERLKENASES